MKVKDYFLTQEEFEIQETEISGVLKTYPIPENIGKYYESKNYISHHQDSGSLKEVIYELLQKFNLKYKKEILKKSVNQITHQKTCLDYGCGAGEFIKYISNDYITFGYEPNENARNFAKQKNNKTKFISHLDEIENQSLDIITLWHVFEHIENQDEILSIFHQKLRSNGKLIIAVPNHTSYDGQKYKNFWAAYDVPRHIYHFSKNGMMKWLSDKKEWKLEKISPLLLDAFYISILSEKYMKNPLFWLFGMIQGAISNFKALKTGEFSSLIYIIRKK